MILINTVDENNFTLNGVPFARIYQPLAQGSNAIGLYSIYDTKLQLVNSTDFNEFAVDGANYATQTETIEALLKVIWSGLSAYNVENLEDRVENLEQNQITGVQVYSTYAELPATGTLLTSYKVSNDTDSAKNGYYHWSGSVYIKDADLSNGVIVSGNTDATSGNTVFEYASAKQDFKLPALNFIDNLARIKTQDQIFTNINGWSIELLLKVNDLPLTQQLISNGTGSPSLSIVSSVLEIGALAVGVNAQVTLAGLEGVNLHLVVTFDGVNHKCYINGVSQTINVLASSPYSVGSGDLVIGGFDETLLLIDADLSLVRTFSRALLAAEIVEHYNNGLPYDFLTEKETFLTCELFAQNYSDNYWFDTSDYKQQGFVSNDITAKNKAIDLSRTAFKEDVDLIKMNNGIIQFQESNELYETDSFSIEMFIAMHDLTTVQAIFTHGLTGSISATILSDFIRLSRVNTANTIQFSIAEMLDTLKHIVITFDGISHALYVDGQAFPFTVLDSSPYTFGKTSINIGAYSAGLQPLNADLSIFRIWKNALTKEQVTSIYNYGKPELKRVDKTLITFEVLAKNCTNEVCFDTSNFKAKGFAILGGVEVNSTLATQATTESETNALSIIPSVINVAEGRELNLWYSSILPFYENGNYIIECICAVGVTSERSFRFTPTTIGVYPLEITVRNLDNNVIATKTIDINVVSKSAGTGTPQIIFIGDSTTDSEPDTYLPNRTKYEMLHEISDMIIADGGANPLFLGLRGVSPYKHQAHAGYSTDLFIANNPTYPNPFWNATNSQNDFKKYMLDNSFFGGTDTIDIAFIQLGINDLKNGGDPVNVMNNLKTLIADINDPVLGYPSAKIVISATPYTATGRSGWGLHFLASQSYSDFIKNMNELCQQIIETFHENTSYPNIFVAPNVLFVDRRFGYPFSETNVSARSTEQINEYNDSVHPNLSGYLQAADSYYSVLRSLL